MIIYNLENWPANAPAYDSPEGWEYQKRIQRTNLITEVSTIPYLLTEYMNRPFDIRYLRIASRLKEIAGVNDSLADITKRLMSERKV